MAEEFDKANHIATAPTSVAVEQILVGIDVERRARFPMQGTQPYELLPGSRTATAPVVPLQVLQQRQPLFELFQVLAHGLDLSSWLSIGEDRPYSQARMVGAGKSLYPQRPEAVEKWENRGPGQLPVAVTENLSTTNPVIERL